MDLVVLCRLGEQPGQTEGRHRWRWWCVGCGCAKLLDARGSEEVVEVPVECVYVGVVRWVSAVCGRGPRCS